MGISRIVSTAYNTAIAGIAPITFPPISSKSKYDMTWPILSSRSGMRDRILPINDESRFSTMDGMKIRTNGTVTANTADLVFAEIHIVSSAKNRLPT